MSLHAIFKLKFKCCVVFISLFLALHSTSFAKDNKVVAVFTELIDDVFVFKVNILRTVPCELYGIELYDINKCSKERSEIEEFNKFYKGQIYKILKPGQNFYISSRKNLGDRWLCEISDNGKIYNKTLVKNSLAKPTAKEYKKIKVDEDKNAIEKKFPKIFECLSGKKREAEKIEATKEPEEATKPEEEKPKIIIEFRKQFGEDFGKDFGE